MNIEYIPKTFWHSLSIAIITITGGFTYVGIKEGQFSVKAASLELATSSNDARAALISEQEITLEKQSKELSELKALYEIKIKELQEAQKQIESLTSRTSAKKEVSAEPVQRAALSILQNVSVDPKFETKVEEKRLEYERLSQQQVQQQQLQTQLQDVQRQLQIK